MLVVIAGPTATGKSGLALELAQQVNGVILGADSRQVYREFDIGTAKPTIAERHHVSHYLIDICDPTQTLTVADYQKQAQQLIATVHSGKPIALRMADGAEAIGISPDENRLAGQEASTPIPFLVGGTGLYLRSVVDGLRIPRVPPHPELRSQLQSLGQPQCYAILSQIDPIAAQKIHAHDEVRTLRALEVFYVTGQPISQQQGEYPPPYPILHIGLDCLSSPPSRTRHSDPLTCRIEQRTHQMVAVGFVEEVDRLCQTYGADLPLLSTLGYQEIKQYLSGMISLEDAIALTILHTRQFAKRQRTWFRANPKIEWFDANDPLLVKRVWERMQQFLSERSDE